MSDIKTVENILSAFDEGRELLTKYAFTPTAAPPPPMTAAPPGGDPNAMPPGGAPPPGMDPNAVPPEGGMPPGADPNAMPPGGAPPPEQGGQIPPQLEGMLSEMANGVQGLSQAVEEQQGTVDQLSQRLLALEEQQSSLRDELKSPAPFEPPVETPQSPGDQMVAPPTKGPM